MSCGSGSDLKTMPLKKDGQRKVCKWSVPHLSETLIKNFLVLIWHTPCLSMINNNTRIASSCKLLLLISPHLWHPCNVLYLQLPVKIIVRLSERGFYNLECIQRCMAEWNQMYQESAPHRCVCGEYLLPLVLTPSMVIIHQVLAFFSDAQRWWWSYMTWPRKYLPTYLHTYSPTYLPTYLPACLLYRTPSSSNPRDLWPLRHW